MTRSEFVFLDAILAVIIVLSLSSKTHLLDQVDTV